MTDRVKVRHIVRGDVDAIERVLMSGGENYGAVTTVEAVVWRHDDPAVTATLDAEVTDPDTGEVTIQLGAEGGWLETAALGLWWLRLAITAGDVGPITWPQNLHTIGFMVEGAASA